MLRAVVLTHRTTRDAGEVVARLLADGVAADRIRVVHNPTAPGQAPPWVPDPAVEVVQAPRNLGYAGGMNLGIRDALDAGADQLLLLSHDVEFDPGTVPALVAAAREQPRFGVLAHELRDAATGALFSLGIAMNRLGATRHLTSPPAEEDGIYVCDAVDGAFSLVRADVLRRVGLFDERLFAYAEEADLHLRVRRAGWKIGVVRGVSAAQDVGGLSRPGPYAYLMTRNGICLGARAAGWPGAVANAARFGFYALVYLRRVVDPRRDPEAKAHARAYAAGVARGLADYLRGRWGPPPDTLAGMGDLRAP